MLWLPNVPGSTYPQAGSPRSLFTGQEGPCPLRSLCPPSQLGLCRMWVWSPWMLNSCHLGSGLVPALPPPIPPHPTPRLPHTLRPEKGPQSPSDLSSSLQPWDPHLGTSLRPHLRRSSPDEGREGKVLGGSLNCTRSLSKVCLSVNFRFQERPSNGVFSTVSTSSTSITKKLLLVLNF